MNPRYQQAGVSQYQLDEHKRLNYIKNVKFIAPQQKVLSFKICLAEAIPCVTPNKNYNSLTQTEKTKEDVRRKTQWAKWKKQAKSRIKDHLAELDQRNSVKNALLRSDPNLMAQGGNLSLLAYTNLYKSNKEDIDSDEEELKHEKPILNAE